ncbi:MAG TPA: cation transporter [Actinomycetales bacterium]|jgi:Co/Zn/Cd efflux system component|nr:cation transporter [Actinomycetales bacterium]
MDALSQRLRRVVLVVAALNFGYFFVEFSVALLIGSVSLFADSVDFLEDTSINVLIFIALGLSLRWQAVAGKVMAVIILIPAAAGAWEAFSKIGNPTPPDPRLLVLTAGGAAIVNLVCALILARFRHHTSSMAKAAFLSARNDVLVNVAIILMGLVTWATMSGIPDLVLGIFIIVIMVGAAKEVWEASEEERLAARALAGEKID